MRRSFRDIHGILLLDKPLGLSSNQALQMARRLVGAAKGGHTGSLDPLATGLLPLCFGEATKIAGWLLGSRKAYEAEVRLGVTTTTADLEGEVVQTRAVPALDDAMLEAALAPLRGRIVQVPPAYSAIKQDGVPLYVKARRGEAVDVPAREVDVYRLDVIERRGDTIRLHVECGSGTYVRSLAVDLGENLGCGAHLTGLRRLWVEPFMTPAMVTLDQLGQAAEAGPDPLDACLLPVEAGLAHIPRVDLDPEQTRILGFGQPVPLGAVAPSGAGSAGHPAADSPVAATGIHGRCAAYGCDGRLMALAEVDGGGVLRVLRGFNLPPGMAGA
ncbi:tRNA pseudouridine(55) synthase TruB [Luteibacter yeojuensis]|uniref:tRNA pseudouridine synthase B n=1 Tax=Luteibacter yeojuensis TaxID=345309 RepID=A0A7X5TPI0_9GAMM|nr:tRNA pseudouridine(55) synthase TruB [Luteibacter yeojuensis]NID15080.1 tRNA pseudouridine(55) synthase TruB [Luteibacter yeojuensis]